MSSACRRSLVVTLIVLLSTSQMHLAAQDRCGTDEYMKTIRDPENESKEQFENWIQRNLRIRSQDTNKSSRKKDGVYKIPVVVHVIHSGESHASNISDAQVLSQIRVLNEDYSRQNADAVNTPAEFASVAGEAGIEFVLAKRTPEGLPTTGIVRVQGPKTTWKVTDNYDLKALSYWPAEDYLNIWVCNLTDYLGYAQFPQSNLLAGLENSSANRFTDGVVIAHTAFGSVADGNFTLQNNYNRGRTTTHEVGHFFGLRHIWGDDQGSCGGNGDYVNDTPDQADRTLNCPSHPRMSCSNRSMFQNFLDYTNDACMNLFTQGQVERMSVILENSPRRKSLLTSPALQDPQSVDNNLGLREVVSPNFGECEGEMTPSVQVRNYGNNAVTSATIVVEQNGIQLESKNFTLNLGPLDSEIVSFSPINIAPGMFTYTFRIITTNGIPDAIASDNELRRMVLVPEAVETPVIESLDVLPEKWQILNPDGLTTWQLVNAANGQAGNKALKMNYYDYEDNEGEIDVLLSPVIHLSDVPAALLLFDVAYAQYQNSIDGLKVYILTNCNADVSVGELLYSKAGATLATVERKTEPYVPAGGNDWRTEILNLENYVGLDRIQIAFVGVNDWGNNIYLDNIRVLTNNLANVTLKAVSSPPPVVCSTTIEPRVLVKNSGTSVTSFEVHYAVDGATNSLTVEGIDLGAGEEIEVTIPEIALQNGLNSLQFLLKNPNGFDDVDPADNAMSLNVVASNRQTAVPFRQDFENNYLEDWTVVSPTGTPTWNSTTLGANTVLFYEGYANDGLGEEAWLVSPSFNLSGTEEASFLFDYSYAIRNEVSDVLEVKVSRGCDAPFETLRTFSGASLSQNTSDNPWSPVTEDDWTRRKFVDLSSLAGEENVRLAFVLRNRNGNNFYFDNFRFYLSADDNPVEVEGVFNVYPNPLRSGTSLFISYNLPEIRDISILITDGMGKQVFNNELRGILNQTDEIETSNLANGLYVLRIKTTKETFFTKFIIQR